MYDTFNCNPSRSNSEYILYISNTAKVCINQQSINESGVKQKILKVLLVQDQLAYKFHWS